jgi:hypothetical protein
MNSQKSNRIQPNRTRKIFAAHARTTLISGLPGFLFRNPQSAIRTSPRSSLRPGADISPSPSVVGKFGVPGRKFVDQPWVAGRVIAKTPACPRPAVFINCTASNHFMPANCTSRNAGSAECRHEPGPAGNPERISPNPKPF